MLLLFFLAWIIFNGNLTLEIALFGVVIALGMFAFICKFMDYSIQKEFCFYKLVPVFFQYIFLLVKEIVQANLTVCRMILSRKEIMEPVIVHVHTNLKTETARVILANSITLTPGTITMEVAEDKHGNDHYYIHWINVTETNRFKAGDAIKGTMEKWIGRIWA